MDVEDYLKQKRELERKKEILEAKEKLKEEPKRPVRETRDAPGVPGVPEELRGEPTLKPWMIWDILMLIIVISLFSTAYFFPRYDNDRIKDIVKSDASLLTGNVVLQQNTNQGTQTDEQGTNSEEPKTDTSPEKKQEPQGTQTQEEDESLPGPEFTMSLKDKTLGEFDRDGKIDNSILVITGPQYYNDLILTLQNDEGGGPIKCDITKDIQIDTDLDSSYEARDTGKVGTLEIDPRSKEDLKESIPGAPEEGTYNGQGKVVAHYTSKCYFCLDSECESIEKRAESSASSMAKVVIRPRATNLTG